MRLICYKNLAVKENNMKCQVLANLECNKSHCILLHTSYNSFYKWTQISSLVIIIFELKNDGKKWSRIYFEIDQAPSELLLPSAKISAQNGRIGLAA